MSTRRNIVANYVGQGVASLASLAVVPVYIRYLGIEAYGLVGLFATLQVWLTLLDLGMTPTLGREMARFTAGAVTIQHTRDLLRSLEIVVFGLAAIVAGTVYLASDWIARDWLAPGALSTGEVAQAMALVGVVIALRFAEGIYRSAIVGLQQMVWLNGAQIILALVRSGGAIAVLALISPTIPAFFIWQGLVSLVTLAVMAAKLHFALPPAPVRPRLSLDALAAVRGFAGGMFAITLLAVLLTQVDKLLLSRLLGLADFGYYVLASTVTAGIMLVSGPVVQAVAPALTRLNASGDMGSLSRVYHQSSQLVSVLLVPAALVLALFPRGVLYAWSGDPLLSDRAAPILTMLTLGTLLNAFMQLPYQLQLAAGWTRLALRVNLVALVVFVPALLWFVPRHGPVAAAACWAALNIGYVTITVPLMHRRLLRGEMRRWYIQDVALPVAGAAAAVALAWLVRPDAGAGRLVWLSFLLATGCLATIGGAAAASVVRARFIGAMVAMRRIRAVRAEAAQPRRR